MRKLIGALILSATLAGCAATAYKQARANANQVRNGMTLAEVVQTLGLPPTSANSEYAYWRRGNAIEYDGTPQGAIRFDFKDGRVVNVPAGGIFNPSTAAEFAKRRDAARAEKARKEQASIEAAEAERAKMIADSVIACSDRQTCAKVFALAQVYVTTVSDQKIQVATDSVIETYNPTEDGNVGVKIVKLPTASSAELIRITPYCRDDRGQFKYVCETKTEAIYKGFRPYVESKLGPLKATGSI